MAASRASDMVALIADSIFRFPLTFEKHQSTYAILESEAEWGPRALDWQTV